MAVRVTNTTETPYLIETNTHIAEFSVITPEEAKFIKPMDMAFLSMIPENDPDLTAYLKETLTTNKPEQQTNTFWFATPENPGKIENHTPIQTGNPIEVYELKEKEKLNQKTTQKPKISLLKDLIGPIHC